MNNLLNYATIVPTPQGAVELIDIVQITRSR